MLSLIFILSLFQVVQGRPSEEQAVENQDAGEGRSLGFWHNLAIDAGLYEDSPLGRQLSENQGQDAGEVRSLGFWHNLGIDFSPVSSPECVLPGSPPGCVENRRMSSEKQVQTAEDQVQGAGEGRSLKSIWDIIAAGEADAPPFRQLSATLEQELEILAYDRRMSSDLLSVQTADKQISDDLSDLILIARRLKATEESRNLYEGDWGTVPEPIDRQLSPAEADKKKAVVEEGAEIAHTLHI